MGFMKRQLELHMEGRNTPYFKKKEPKEKEVSEKQALKAKKGQNEQITLPFEV